MSAAPSGLFLLPLPLDRVTALALALRAGARRGLSMLPYPVDALLAELDLRDQAMAEVDAR